MPTHITPSGGLISAAFIESIRGPGARQRGVEPESFALPWSAAPASPAAMEETIATAWKLLLDRWDAVRVPAGCGPSFRYSAPRRLNVKTALESEHVVSTSNLVNTKSPRSLYLLSRTEAASVPTARK